MTEPAIYFTTTHPPAVCTCSGRIDVYPKKHVWSCPARCRSFRGVGSVAVNSPHMQPATTNADRCALETDHACAHESYSGRIWR